MSGGESLIGRRGYRPYFEGYAYDTAVVDVIWNGFLESYKIAAMAETYELNIAPHNFYGYLAEPYLRAPRGGGAEPDDHGIRGRRHALAL